MTEQIIALISSPTGTSLVWILFFILVLWMFKKDIKNLLNKTTNVQIGSFALTVAKNAKNLDAENVLKDLQGLSYADLKIFMILCGEDGDSYNITFQIETPKLRAMYQRFQDKELLILTKDEVLANGNHAFGYKTTLRGQKIHRAIIDSLYSELRK